MEHLDRNIRGLSIIGVIAGSILIFSAVSMFILEEYAPYLMILAVGCGIIVNLVLSVLSFLRKQMVRSVCGIAVVLLLGAVFLMQILIL